MVTLWCSAVRSTIYSGLAPPLWGSGSLCPRIEVSWAQFPAVLLASGAFCHAIYKPLHHHPAMGHKATAGYGIWCISAEPSGQECFIHYGFLYRGQCGRILIWLQCLINKFVCFAILGLWLTGSFTPTGHHISFGWFKWAYSLDSLAFHYKPHKYNVYFYIVHFCNVQYMYTGGRYILISTCSSYWVHCSATQRLNIRWALGNFILESANSLA